MCLNDQSSPLCPETDFGYQVIPMAEKAERVATVFNTVAGHYDVMNDLLSLGLHRLWKRFVFAISQVRAGDKLLDVATGTGDLAQLFAQRVGGEGQVWLLDVNRTMLSRARDRLLDAGQIGNTIVIQADAEALPFADNYFDHVSIAFGLRNITRKEQALAAMYRVLKPGGQLLLLEFSKPQHSFLQTLYDAYSFYCVPRLGAWVAKSAASYQYLVESIRCHPGQKALQQMVLQVGFDRCDYYNLSGGIVALHKAWKC